MGLILDPSVLVAAERQGQSARQALEAIAPKIGNVEIAISVVTVIELPVNWNKQHLRRPASEIGVEQILKPHSSAAQAIDKKRNQEVGKEPRR
jgi:hypothetical protein